MASTSFACLPFLLPAAEGVVGCCRTAVNRRCWIAPRPRLGAAPCCCKRSRPRLGAVPCKIPPSHVDSLHDPRYGVCANVALGCTIVPALVPQGIPRACGTAGAAALEGERRVRPQEPREVRSDGCTRNRRGGGTWRHGGGREKHGLDWWCERGTICPLDWKGSRGTLLVAKREGR